MEFTKINVKRDLKAYLEDKIRQTNRYCIIEQFQQGFWGVDGYENHTDTEIWIQPDNVDANILPYRMNIVSLMRGVSESSALETILKSKNEKALAYFINMEKKRLKFLFPIYCVCMRHNYQVNDFKLWEDTVLLLKEAKMDYHNPKYVCPQDLRNTHDMALRRIERHKEQLAMRARKEFMGEGSNDVFWYLINHQEECLKACKDETYFKNLKDVYGIGDFDVRIELLPYTDLIQLDFLSNPDSINVPKDLEDLAIPSKILFTTDNDQINLANQCNEEIATRLKHNFREKWQKVIDEYINSEYVSKKSHLLNLKFVKDDIEIVSLNSIQEFKTEGNYMHNCVYWSQYYDMESSLILSARRNGDPFANIEIDVDTLEMRQCFGPYNNDLDLEDQTAIKDIIARNIDILKERIKLYKASLNRERQC